MMIGYIISSQDMSVADMENAVYASYEEPIVLDEDGEYIIYVMIVDGGMNIRYLRSDRIIIDKTAPVINGIEDGRIYCSGQTFTVTEEYLYGVFVNNEEIKPENGVYTLPFGKNSIVVYDRRRDRLRRAYSGFEPRRLHDSRLLRILLRSCHRRKTARFFGRPALRRKRALV